MRRYLARGIGVVIGIPAGFAGILFGFLIGALVDQYRRNAPTDAALDRYLARPSSERSDERALLYGSAVLIAMVIGRDSPDLDRRITKAAGMPWPGSEVSSRRVFRRQIALERITRRAVERREMISYLAVVDDLARRISRDVSYTLLHALSCVGLETVIRNPEAEPYLQEVIDTTAEAFGVETVTVGNNCGTYHALDTGACRLLGVGPDVEKEELKHTYRRLAAQMHPDTGVSLEEHQQNELAGAFVRIREAYERLLAQIEVRDRSRYGAPFRPTK